MSEREEAEEEEDKEDGEEEGKRHRRTFLMKHASSCGSGVGRPRRTSGRRRRGQQGVHELETEGAEEEDEEP